MSLFASYYGIDNSATNEDIHRKPADFIDKAQFDANAYVKELLLTKSVENLIAEDTRIVQEVKTLDSDMQMLVYENYNKFISATETIQHMKKNFDAMNEDMKLVEGKMKSISGISSFLDSSTLESKKKVDKLVRIKSLLNKLDFLCELPEKLQDMIGRELYHPAVKLYNKTITVLKSHAHVLSFKHIQERTERMMADLRGKVSNLLDDPSLDAEKLTQYVVILRLMKAPKLQVITKLMAAHRLRTVTLTQAFNKEFDHHHPGITQIRRFHQSLVVGLVEACKGVSEMFCTHYMDEENSEKIPKNTEKNFMHEKNNFKHEEKIFMHEKSDLELHVTAYGLLTELLHGVMPGYEAAMVRELAAYCNRYREAWEEVKDLEMKFEEAAMSQLDSKTSNLESSLRRARARAEEVHGERTAWVQLARQSVTDVQYLDKSAGECAVQHNCNGYTEPLNATPSAYRAAAPGYAYSLLTVLNAHLTYCFWRRVTDCLESLLAVSSDLLRLCDPHVQEYSTQPVQVVQYAVDERYETASHESGNSRTSSSHGYSSGSTHGVSTSPGSGPGPLAVRLEIQRRAALTRPLYDTFSEVLVNAFSSLLNTDLKPVLDIFNVLESTVSSTVRSTCTSTVSSSTVRSPPRQKDRDGRTHHHHHGKQQQVVHLMVPRSIARYPPAVSSSSTSTSTCCLPYEQQQHIDVLFGHVSPHVKADSVSNLYSSSDCLTVFTWTFLHHVSQAIEYVSSTCNRTSTVSSTSNSTGETHVTGRKTFSSDTGQFVLDSEDGIFLQSPPRTQDVIIKIGSSGGIGLSGGNSSKSSGRGESGTDLAYLYSSTRDGGMFSNVFAIKEHSANISGRVKEHSANVPQKNKEHSTEDSVENSKKILQTKDRSAENYENIPQNDKKENVGVSSHFSVGDVFVLVSSIVLRKLSPNILKRLENELKVTQLPPLAKDASFRAKCSARLETTSQELLSIFIISTTERFTSQSLLCLHDLYKSSRNSLTLDNFSISPRTVLMAQALDALSTICCVLLSETPPQARATSTGSTGAGNAYRRASLGAGGAGGGAVSSLQLDIERLFTQKVKIFENDVTALVPTLDTIVGSAIKAILKGTQEYLKFTTISLAMNLKFQAYISFLKQVCHILLRDASEAETLVDAVSNTLFSRFAGANDISSLTTDNSETIAISKITGMAMLEVSKNATLLQKV